MGLIVYCCLCIFYFVNFLGSKYFITLAGLPTTTALSGTSFVTTAPAPTIAFSPMVTPVI